MTVQYLVGDVREVMATIADGSVDLIATSPPFLALRSYLPAGHDQKHNEIGSEANPAAYIDMLLNLTAEWGRVLAPHGSIAIELGDTYSGSGGAGGDYGSNGIRAGQPSFRQGSPTSQGHIPRQTEYGANLLTNSGGPAWPRAKCLALIPQLYAVALAYGINPLTGQPSPAGRWLVRNVIVWARPNPSPGALGDKVRPSTSYIVIATRSPKRWFDLTAVRGEPSPNTHARLARGVEVAPRNGKSADRDGNYDTMPELAVTAGAPPLDTWTDPYDGTHDTWTLTTQPSPLHHYAMWPARLAERLVLMMCPAFVCRVCGEPRRRVETVEHVADHSGGGSGHTCNGSGEHGGTRRIPMRLAVSAQTTGWTDCGCKSPSPGGVESDTSAGGLNNRAPSHYRPGLTLDPFAGSGTTLAVADLHHRDAIGIDLDPRNHDLYPARYHEVKKALYGTPAPQPGQGVLAL